MVKLEQWGPRFEKEGPALGRDSVLEFLIGLVAPKGKQVWLPVYMLLGSLVPSPRFFKRLGTRLVTRLLHTRSINSAVQSQPNLGGVER